MFTKWSAGKLLNECMYMGRALQYFCQLMSLHSDSSKAQCRQHTPPYFFSYLLSSSTLMSLTLCMWLLSLFIWPNSSVSEKVVSWIRRNKTLRTISAVLGSCLFGLFSDCALEEHISRFIYVMLWFFKMYFQINRWLCRLLTKHIRVYFYISSPDLERVTNYGNLEKDQPHSPAHVPGCEPRPVYNPCSVELTETCWNLKTKMYSTHKDYPLALLKQMQLNQNIIC